MIPRKEQSEIKVRFVRATACCDTPWVVYPKPSTRAVGTREKPRIALTLMA